jgi:hypothetical protein
MLMLCNNNLNDCARSRRAEYAKCFGFSLAIVTTRVVGEMACLHGRLGQRDRLCIKMK